MHDDGVTVTMTKEEFDTLCEQRKELTKRLNQAVSDMVSLDDEYRAFKSVAGDAKNAFDNLRQRYETAMSPAKHEGYYERLYNNMHVLLAKKVDECNMYLGLLRDARDEFKEMKAQYVHLLEMNERIYMSLARTDYRAQEILHMHNLGLIDKDECMSRMNEIYGHDVDER